MNTIYKYNQSNVDALLVECLPASVISEEFAHYHANTIYVVYVCTDKSLNHFMCPRFCQSRVMYLTRLCKAERFSKTD